MRCSLSRELARDLLIDDIRELRGRPYDLVAVAGGWKHLTRPAYADAIRACGSSGRAVDLTWSDVLMLMCSALPADYPRRIVVGFREVISRDLIGHLRHRPDRVEPAQSDARRSLHLCDDKSVLLEFGLDTLRDLPDCEALEDAGLLSRDELLAGEIMPELASGHEDAGLDTEE
nr:SMC-Scp complex subunit ScpB [Mesorhizobium sp. M4A.F.Ca.ET.022.05.2.1]